LIAKHISMQSVHKYSFAKLAAYMTADQGKAERVGTVQITNCHSATVEWAVREVRATQAQNTRAGADKTYHLLIGFPAGEVPSGDVLRDIEERVCMALGYGEHQRISAVHHDTDHLHLHVAINKIHPQRLTMHEPYRDYQTLGAICEKLEIEHGLQRVNHSARKQHTHNRADDMEHNAGIESLTGWIRRECLDRMQNAQTWKDLHDVMHEHGLTLRERGNGLVIVDSGGMAVKASSVARELSKAKLEARLGAFAPFDASATGGVPVREYQARPLPSPQDTVALYARYRDDQQAMTSRRAAEWANARHTKNRLVEAAKRRGRLKRAAIKLMGSGKLANKALYALTSRTLRKEIEQINKQYLEERQTIYDNCRRRAWNDWLRHQAKDGDGEALSALRARDARHSMQGDAVSGKLAQTGHAAPRVVPDSITKNGTVIYRHGTTVIRDDGKRLDVSPGATQDGLETALRMTMQRYGNSISVGGSDAFRERIAQAAAAAKLDLTFDDDALERRRRHLLPPLTEKERERGQRDPEQQQRGISDRGRPEAGGHAVRGKSRSAGVTAGRSAGGPAPGRGKPHVARPGQCPPPQGKNRLRNLSELDVVRFAGRSEMLLPGHVPHHVEHQGAESNRAVRRGVPWPGLTDAQRAAADQYIAEREAKRARGLDIPKHKLYEAEDERAGVYAGVRRVAGQPLALLKRGDDILVLPVDEATARRIGRLALGCAVTVTPQGSIKSQGRSR
jgi:Fe-S cluster biosynthesis and repair protein YggX